MKVLIDTSCWIQTFRNPNSFEAQVIGALLKENAVVTSSLIIAELLQGAKGSKEKLFLENEFNVIPILEGIDRLGLKIGELGLNLRKNGYNLALEIAHIYLEDKTPEKSLDRLADMLMSAKTDIENFRGHTSNLIGMFNCWAKIADEEMNKEPYLRMPASGSSSDRFIQQISLGDRKKY